MNLRDAIASYCACRRQQGVECDYPTDLVVDRGTYWYLPDPQPLVGCRGLIVSKEDGTLSWVGSALSRAEAFWAYERGILEGKHELIITACSPDLDATIDLLTKTPPSQRGKRQPGPGREAWYKRLSSLPTVIFSNADLCSYVWELMEAERKGIFTFEIRPCATH